MRINRFKIPHTTLEHVNCKVGKALLLKEGTYITLITIGILVSRALEAAVTLEKEGVSVRVIEYAYV